jgi:hypothetical protein
MCVNWYDDQINSLGRVDPSRSQWHTPRLIYPIGFHSTRVHDSWKTPSEKTQMDCRIIEDQQGNPRFLITAKVTPYSCTLLYLFL